MKRPRILELEAELSAWRGRPVTLVSVRNHSEQPDETYSVVDEDGRRFAIARVTNPHAGAEAPIVTDSPTIHLSPQERLEREWTAYERGWREGYTPKPLWRCDDAMVCEWLDLDRALQHLTQHPDRMWDVLNDTLTVIAGIHEEGITHLDLHLGNVLLTPDRPGVVLIDFDYGPAPWLTVAQQMALDYLRLIEDCIKRCRSQRHGLLAGYERLTKLLDPYVAGEARQAELSFILRTYKQLSRQPRICEALRRVFPGL